MRTTGDTVRHWDAFSARPPLGRAWSLSPPLNTSPSIRWSNQVLGGPKPPPLEPLWLRYGPAGRTPVRGRGARASAPLHPAPRLGLLAREQGARDAAGQIQQGRESGGIAVLRKGGGRDGAVLDVPDTAENAAEFGYSGKVDVNRSAFPQVRIATLSEVGTHATITADLWARIRTTNGPSPKR